MSSSSEKNSNYDSSPDSDESSIELLAPSSDAYEGFKKKKKSSGEGQKFWNMIGKKSKDSKFSSNRSGKCSDKGDSFKCRGPPSITTVVTKLLKQQANCCDPAVVVAVRQPDADLPKCFRRAPQVVFVPNPFRCCKPCCCCCPSPCCCCPQATTCCATECCPCCPPGVTSSIKKCSTCWRSACCCCPGSSQFNNCNFFDGSHQQRRSAGVVDTSSAKLSLTNTPGVSSAGAGGSSATKPSLSSRSAVSSSAQSSSKQTSS